MKVFGPVPSRRLGNSLGINNIPPKVCTYSCVYCQIGITKQLSIQRREFYSPDELAMEVRDKVTEITQGGSRIDYLSFVPDGEPTLDGKLGEHIELLRPLGIPVAVLTNGSLINLKEVREDLQKADLVSLKTDALTSRTWRKIDRPHRSLNLEAIRDGMYEFAREFKGEIITETMLLKGFNDSYEEMKTIANFLRSLKPLKSYISIPTRPTPVRGVVPADNKTLTMAYQVLRENGSPVEYLVGYEGNEFGFCGNVEEDLLAITSVHPMREEAVRAILKRAGADWNLIGDLVRRGSLTEVEYQGTTFYLRKLPRKA